MKWLRDWWRGWSDDDLESVLRKVEYKDAKPGGLIPVTHRELRAHAAFMRAIHPVLVSALPQRHPARR